MGHESAAARWLIEFVRSDPGKWTAEVIGNFQNKWATLLGTLWKGEKPPGSSRMNNWHQELGKTVEKLEQGEPWAEDCKLWRQIRFDAGQAIIAYRTNPLEKDGYLIRAMDAFEAAGEDMRICQRPDCQKLFVRSKRQAYCSAKCRGTELKRRYRKKENN